MHLNACDEPCAWSKFHKCMQQLNTASAISCIPKKLSEYDVAATDPQDVFAWGLEAKHQISALRVVVYHVLILLLPFAFWAWWQVMYPTDLQNASVPLSVVIALVSLFWGANGILTQGKSFGNESAFDTI